MHGGRLVWDFLPLTYREICTLTHKNCRLKTPTNLEMREIGLPAWQQCLYTSVLPLLHPDGCQPAALWLAAVLSGSAHMLVETQVL